MIFLCIFHLKYNGVYVIVDLRNKSTRIYLSGYLFIKDMIHFKEIKTILEIKKIIDKFVLLK